MTPTRLLFLVVAGCLTALCAMQLSVQGPVAGTVLVGMAGHGVHTHDLPAIAAWSTGMLACVLGWRRAD